VISVSSLLRQTGSSSRSKIDRRIARVLSAIGAAVSHFSPNSPKLFASFMRRFSRCFSIAGDRPRDRAPGVDALLSGPGKRQSVVRTCRT
jgi:hypothetical protein